MVSSGSSEKYKLEKEMQREERISRQWPPSEIAMENGNTMIPPVARTCTGHGAVGGQQCNFNYTNYNISAREFREPSSQSFQSWRNSVILESEERNYYY